jgi:hypothetical protein
VAGILGLALEDPVDEVVLALGGAGLELELAADLPELVHAHLAEVADGEVIALARRLYLLLLLPFRDRGTEGGLTTASRSTVSGTLIGAWCGHLDGIT